MVDAEQGWPDQEGVKKNTPTTKVDYLPRYYGDDLRSYTIGTLLKEMGVSSAVHKGPFET
jgi:hypothetical protein